MSRISERRSRRSRRPSTWSTSSAAARPCARSEAVFTGRCPFHDDRSPSFSVDPRQAVLLLRLPGAGEMRSGSRRRPRTWTSWARSSGWPTATASSSPTRSPLPRPSAAATSSAACWRCSRTPPASTPATCGSRPRASPRALPGRARPPGPDRARLPARVRTDRLGPGVRGGSREGLLARRARAGGALEPGPARPRRPLLGAADVPACRRPRSCARLAPGRCPAASPKYLNSPEGTLFRKSEVVFALDRARSAIAANGRAVVVEGIPTSWPCTRPA